MLLLIYDGNDYMNGHVGTDTATEWEKIQAVAWGFCKIKLAPVDVLRLQQRWPWVEREATLRATKSRLDWSPADNDFKIGSLNLFLQIKVLQLLLQPNLAVLWAVRTKPASAFSLSLEPVWILSCVAFNWLRQAKSFHICLSFKATVFSAVDSN